MALKKPNVSVTHPHNIYVCVYAYIYIHIHVFLSKSLASEKEIILNVYGPVF